MTKQRLLVPSAAAASFLIAAAAPMEVPSFGPEEGAQLTKTFVTVSELDLDDFSAIVDGQDVGAMLGGLEFSIRTETSVAVGDSYGKSEGGRPLSLTRTFDKLEGLVTLSAITEFGGEDEDMELSSELEGESVVFAWNDEEGAYETAFADDEGDEELLAGLEEDMDMRVFLPAEEVSKGDTWTIELAELASLGMPGGDMLLVPEETDEELDFDVGDIFGDEMMDKMKDLFEGGCECTYLGVREQDGLSLGEIQVAMDVSSGADLTEFLLEMIDEIAASVGEDVPEMDIEAADLELEVKGEGLLQWDLAAGRMHSFDLTGDVSFTFDLAIGIEEMGEAHSAELTVEMSGTLERQVSVEE